MSTQTRNRVIDGPLSVVVRPGSEAEASYRSAVLAPGFGPEPGLDLRFFGGKTLPHLRYSIVYLGGWQADERNELDRALAAAMRDRGLNNVLAQYFPGTEVTTTFAGSKVHDGKLPARVTRNVVEALVPKLDLGPTVACLLLPKGAVLVDTASVDSKHGLGGYHGSVKAGGSERYYAVAVYSEGDNGIVAFDEPWKNVCATLYHELQETRTDPDVEDAIRLGSAPGADRLLGWYSPRGGEIGDIPMAEAGGTERYYAVSVYSEGDNGIVAFDEPWKNVCATLYHELQETRTDPDVEDAIRLGSAPGADRLLGWYSPRGGEIGDIPMAEAGGDLGHVMKEVPLADGSGTVPIQLMWSNAVGGPEGPTPTPHQPR